MARWRWPQWRKPQIPQPTQLRSGATLAVTWGLAAFALYLMVLFGSLVVQGYTMEQQAQALEAENARLAAESQALRDRAAYVRSDAAIELAARDMLDMAKPGDVVLHVSVVTPTLTVSPTAALEAPAAEPAALPPVDSTPNWRRWLEALFDS